MSREERRAYQRQMKGLERGPALPPAAKARAERNAARRAQRTGRSSPATPAGLFTPRFWLRSVVIAAIVGILGFSWRWDPSTPMTAIVVGLIAGGVALLVLIGVRLLQRRLSARP